MPPKKRSKPVEEKENIPTNDGRKASNRKPGKQKDISSLVDMPLDICFEVRLYFATMFSFLSTSADIQASRARRLVESRMVVTSV